MITWGQYIERHIKGVSNSHIWWIRTDKNEKVLGLYMIGKKTEKFTPNDGIEETIMGMKLRAEIIAETHDFAQKIADEQN